MYPTAATTAHRGERIHQAAGSAIGVIVALWLVVSPYVLGYSVRETVNEITCGVMLFLLEAMRVETTDCTGGVRRDDYVEMDTAASWLSGLIGVWLMVSPFVLDYADLRVGIWNVVVVGAVTLALAVCTAVTGTSRRRRRASTG